jgi:hypothetical protein
VIDAPADQAQLATTTPTISGSCEDAATVTVLDGSSSACTATCASGAFSCTANTLSNDSHVLTATQTDRANNTGPASAAVTVTVDNIPPEQPVVLTPPDMAHLSDNRPTLTGTCETGTTVDVLELTSIICTATCASSAFSCRLTVLTDGPHTVTVRLTDAANNVSPLSTLQLNIDTMAPSAPTAAGPTDGTLTKDSTVTFTGTCENGATVNIYEENSVVCSTTCTGSGSYECESGTITDGPHTFSVGQADTSENASPKTGTFSIMVDTTPPASPTITSPGDGLLTNDATPAIVGDCEADASVVVSDGQTVLCTVTCDAGAFMCTSPSLSNGAHSLTATQTDVAGNMSQASTAVDINVDTTAADAPVITNPTNNFFTSNTTPTFAGSCEEGDTVTVTDGTNNLCTSTCSGSQFSCAAESAIAEGRFSITASQADQAGNVSASSTAVSVRIDTTAPTAPALSSPDDNALSNDDTPTFRGNGTCENNATVTVKENSTVLCTATCTCDTNPCTTPTSFSCDSSALLNGAHSIVVSQADRAGNVSPDSTARTLNIDTQAATAPTITSPADGVLSHDNTVTVSGACETGGTVTVVENGSPLCTSPCMNSAYSCVTSVLSDGGHSIAARQTDQANNVSATSTAVSRRIDTTAPAKAVLNAPTAGSLSNNPRPTIGGTCETGATVSVLENTSTLCSAVCVSAAFSCTSQSLTDGHHTVLARQRDAAGNNSDLSASLSFDIDSTAPAVPSFSGDQSLFASAMPTIMGACESGATVSVREGSDELCSAACVGSMFTCMTSELSDGDHMLTVLQTDAAGSASELSDVRTVSIDTMAPSAPTASDWPMSATMNNMPDLSGMCVNGSTVKVMDGDNTVCTTECSDSKWSCKSGKLDDGEHMLRVVQTDAAGNTSSASDSFTVNVDTTAPDAPSPANPGSGDGNVTNSSPTFSGSCASGSKVEVVEGDNVLCSATCGDDGKFSCKVDHLDDGEHHIAFRQTDAAGNVSTSSTTDITSKGTLPSAPAITSVNDGAFSNAATLPLTGSCEDGSTVTVSDGDNELCTTACDGGSFSCDPISLDSGEHTLKVSQTDAAGNTSDIGSLSFTVDRDAPSAPSFTTEDDAVLTEANELNLTGSCEDGSTVTAYEDSDVLCTSSCDGGSYTCKSKALSPGDHVITVKQKDRAGNVSIASEPRTVTVGESETGTPDAGTAPTSVDDDGCSCSMVGGRKQTSADGRALGLLICAAVFGSRIRRRRNKR